MIGRRIMRQPPPTPSLILDVIGTFGVYFNADPVCYYEDSAATIPASVGGRISAMRSFDGAMLALHMSADKPFLHVTPQTGIHWAHSNTINSKLTVTFATALGSDCTVVRATTQGVVFEEGQTIGTIYNIAPSYRFNADVLIVNRALTVAEKALLTQFMGRRVPMLGPNEFVDPGFDNPAVWSAATPDWVVQNGVATKTAGSIASVISQISPNIPNVATDFVVAGYDVVLDGRGSLTFAGLIDAIVFPNSPGTYHVVSRQHPTVAPGLRGFAITTGILDNAVFRRIR